MSNLDILAHEASLLRAAIAIHKKHIVSAYARKEAAEIAVEEVFGFSPWQLEGTFVAYEEARAEVRRLNDEDGYYWAQSRLSDLTYFLGLPGEQIPFSTGNRVWTLRGDMPAVHPSVPKWVAKVAFGATPEGTIVESVAYGEIAA